MVVYTTSNGGYVELAERVAADRDDALLTDLDDALAADEQVVYVDPPSTITEDRMVALQQRLSRDGPTRGGFSVLTGYTPDHAEALYDRRMERGDRHCVLMRKAHDTPDSDPETEVLTAYECTIDSLRDLMDQGMESLSLHSSGRAIHLYLDGGMLCGYPEMIDVSEYDDTQPYCVTDGERDCPLTGDILPAQEMDVRHVFITTCSSMIDNNRTGLPVHVGLGLLSTVESLIGSYQITPSVPHEPFFHYSLVRAGYDVVERCYLLNRTADQLNSQPYPYVPFGRPDAATYDAPTQQYDVRLDADDDGVLVECTNVDAHVVDVCVPLDDLPGDGEEFFVRSIDDDYDTLYYTAFREGDDVRIVAFAGRQLSTDSLPLRLSRDPVAARQRAVLFDSTRTVYRHDTLSLLPSKSQRKTDNFRDHVLGLPKQIAYERLDATAHRSIADELDNIWNEQRGVRDELLSLLKEVDYLFSPDGYGRSAIERDSYQSDLTCHRCGRSLFVKTVVDVTGSVGRAVGNCPKCAFIFDTPCDPDQEWLTYPTISGDGYVTGDEPMTVTFENPLDQPMDATFFPTLCTSDETGQYFEPAYVERSLDAGEEATVEFQPDLDALESTEENEFYVAATVVGNLELYVGMGTMNASGRPGYVPSQRL